MEHDKLRNDVRSLLHSREVGPSIDMAFFFLNRGTAPVLHIKACLRVLLSVCKMNMKTFVVSEGTVQIL